MHTDGKLAPGFAAVAVLDGLATGVLLLDQSCRLLYLNSAAEVLLAVSANRGLGCLAEDFLGMGAVLQGAVVAAAAGHTTTFREIQIKKRSFSQGNDENMMVDCTISPFAAGSESLWAVLEIVKSEPIGRETEWHEHKLATQQIVRSLAHEIKNPLGGLRGAAQLLSRQIVGEDLQEYTKIIIDEADRLTKLVDRMISSRRSLAPEIFNLHEVLEHVRYLIEVEFGEGIYLRRDYDPSIPVVTGQKEYLIQAVLNVARNAAQAIDGVGRIEFRTRVRRQSTVGGRRHRHVLEATISDTGPGIPKHLQDKIFLPMITGRSGGTGLGLTLAQEIVDMLGGTIEYATSSGGARFTFLLPVGQTS